MSESAPDTMDAPRRSLLEVDNVTIKFGGVTALDSVTFDIKEGEILGLIGPNGAGKTTCFNVMTGVYQATSGQVRFDGRPLAKMKRLGPDRPLPDTTKPIEPLNTMPVGLPPPNALPAEGIWTTSGTRLPAPS